MSDASLKYLQPLASFLAQWLPAPGELGFSTAALPTLETYVANLLVRRPGEDKGTRIRKANANFQARLGKFDGAYAVLEALGFQEADDGFFVLQEQPALQNQETINGSYFKYPVGQRDIWLAHLQILRLLQGRYSTSGEDPKPADSQILSLLESENYPKRPDFSDSLLIASADSSSTIPVSPSYRILGCTMDMTDGLLLSGFEAKCRLEPARKAVFMDALCDLANGRKSAYLQKQFQEYVAKGIYTTAPPFHWLHFLFKDTPRAKYSQVHT